MSRALASVIAAAIMRERGTITRTLKAAGIPEADAEDVCQDVILVALAAAQEGRLSWERRPTLQRWLYVVACRHALAYQQRAARRELLYAHVEDARTVPSVEELYINRETLRIAARSTTPERWRALRLWANGGDVADIARREGIAVPTVYNRIRLAREDFKAAARRDARCVPLVRCRN